jgi:hypothetical protein
MNIDNSLIFKQLEKQSYDILKDIDIWINIYSDSLSKLLTPSKKKIYYIVSNLHLLCDNNIDIKKRQDILLSQFETKAKLKNITSVIQIFLISCFMDIYTILRMFKQPTDGIKSSISFGYFGDAHVKSIVNILVEKLLLYDIVDNKESEFRCLHLNKSINIQNDLNIYNRLIDSKKLYKVLNNYLSKIIDINKSKDSKIHEYTIEELMHKIIEISNRLYS